MEKVYKKVGRRYVPMGFEFTGFPSDGIWLVQDGTRNMICLIGAKEIVPRHALPFRIMAEKLTGHLVKKLSGKPHSWQDVATECADFFALESEGGNEPVV